MTACFVTATGTDIGKTFVTAGLIRALTAQGRAVDALKPVVSGFDPNDVAASDTGALLAALGQAPSAENIDRISPWRFSAPLSPDMAARRENRAIDLDRLIAFCRDRTASAADMLLIEGVGGIMAPLDDTHTVLDWMAALGLPILLVTGSYLGTLSHTLTALDVLRRRKLRVQSVVVSESAGSTVALDETAGTIGRFAEGIDITALPRDAATHAGVFADLARRL
jgi:dethiobiotin synthetase